MKDQHNYQRPKSKCRRGRAVRIGEVVNEVFEDAILQGQDRLRELNNNWQQLLPVGLSRHCRLGGLSGGVLQIEVESALYASELQLCKAELLGELRRRCPRARIKAMKLVIAGAGRV